MPNVPQHLPSRSSAVLHYNLIVRPVLFLFGTIGNCVYVAFFLRSPAFRKYPISQTILVKVLSDIVHMTINLLSWVPAFLPRVSFADTDLANWLCKLYSVVITFAIAIDNYMVMIIALERVCACYFSLRYGRTFAHNMIRLWIVVTLIPGLAIALMLMAYYGQSTTTDEVMRCGPVSKWRWVHLRILTPTYASVITFMPLTVILIATIATIVHLLRQRRKMSLLRHGNDKTASTGNVEDRSAVTETSSSFKAGLPDTGRSKSGRKSFRITVTLVITQIFYVTIFVPPIAIWIVINQRIISFETQTSHSTLETTPTPNQSHAVVKHVNPDLVEAMNILTTTVDLVLCFNLYAYVLASRPFRKLFLKWVWPGRRAPQIAVNQLQPAPGR